MNEQNSRTKKIVELISEDDDRDQVSNDFEGAEVAQFSVLPGIQDELLEFIKKKLLDSIELQQYIVRTEIEFFEKYIDFLTKQEDRGCYNNHNDLEEYNHSEMTNEEREIALDNAKNHLNGLKTKQNNLGRREQKACNYLSFGIGQIKMTTPLTSESGHYKIKNKSWICTLNNSISLQKIKMICEKLLEVDLIMEVSFWTSEIGNLLEKLDQNEREIAFGIIFEMVIWASESSSNCHLLTLLNNLMEREDSKKHIIMNLEQICVIKEERIDNYLWNTKILAALFVKLSVTDQVYREKFGQSICQLMIRTLENPELKVNQLMGIIEVFESVGRKLGNILEKYDQLFSLFEAKTHILERSEHARISHLMKFRSNSSHLPIPVFVGPTLTSARVSVRNLTVIEYPSDDSGNTPPVLTQEKLDELEKKITERFEREMRIKEENRAEERRLRELEDEKKRKEEEKRKKEEEEERKQKEKEMKERMRMEIENEFRMEEMKRKEQERRDAQLAAELQAQNEREMELEKQKKRDETERKQQEENRRIALEQSEKEKKRRLEEKQKEDLALAQALQLREQSRQNNPCTFLKDSLIYRHCHPNSAFRKNVFDGKIIGLYFSGHWCPPSRDFTPVLRNFHAQVHDDFDVLFISSDNNEQEMNMYLTQYHGDWYHFPFGSFEGLFLKNQIQVNSIPSLIITKPNGQIITEKGRDEVSNCQNPRALVNHWKSL